MPIEINEIVKAWNENDIIRMLSIIEEFPEQMNDIFQVRLYGSAQVIIIPNYPCYYSKHSNS